MSSLKYLKQLFVTSYLFSIFSIKQGGSYFLGSILHIILLRKLQIVVKELFITFSIIKLPLIPSKSLIILQLILNHPDKPGDVSSSDNSS